ncbi:MAG: ACT domain-containing protein [Desulfovibrio sp.]|jgi:hypothetical protein|nr:ACT domain-containing protein [Desulfovibrio sp.]
MKIEQISVFLENKAGRMAEVTGILAAAGVNITALALADTSEFGILRLIVDKTEEAKDALKARGFTVAPTQVVAVEVKHAAGGLHAILTILKNRKINVEYMYCYPFPGNEAVMIFRFDRPELALEELVSHRIRVFSKEDLRL